MSNVVFNHITEEEYFPKWIPKITRVERLTRGSLGKGAQQRFYAYGGSTMRRFLSRR